MSRERETDFYSRYTKALTTSGWCLEMEMHMLGGESAGLSKVGGDYNISEAFGAGSQSEEAIKLQPDLLQR